MIWLPVMIAFATQQSAPAIADPQTYLAEVTKLMRVDWPKNRTIQIVCHGHSVPAGYFQTPIVSTFSAYPSLLHGKLCTKFPHAVMNVIVTAIGGETSEQGAKRFAADVLSLRPDVVTIDYSLNDRFIGLDRAKKAWVQMIEESTKFGAKVILLTPTPDQDAKLEEATDPLNEHAEQVRNLAREYHVGLVDSLAAFQKAVKPKATLATFMAQSNHPNRKGHLLVANALMNWFP